VRSALVFRLPESTERDQIDVVTQSLANAGRQFVAVDAGKSDIQDGYFGMIAHDSLQPGLAISRYLHVMAEPPQPKLQKHAHVGVVLDHDDTPRP
jgi:hypothetical protein